MTWDERIARLRAFGAGQLTVSDWFPHGSNPYRGAWLLLDEVPHDRAVETISDWMRLAVEVGGYLSVHTHSDYASMQIQIDRPLTADEVGDPAPSIVWRAVP